MVSLPSGLTCVCSCVCMYVSWWYRPSVCSMCMYVGFSINSFSSIVGLCQHCCSPSEAVTVHMVGVLFFWPPGSVAPFAPSRTFVPPSDAGDWRKAGAGLLEFLRLSVGRFWDSTEGEGGTVAGGDAQVAGAQSKILAAVTFYDGWGVRCKALSCSAGTHEETWEEQEQKKLPAASNEDK